MLDKLPGIELKGFPVDANDTPNETPSTGISSLPTPQVDNEKWIRVLTSEWTPEGDRTRIEAPGAPRIRDLDSFTEGTGKGSFDSIPADITNEFGEFITQPDPFSLGLLPEINHNHFIEIWREGVDAERETETEDSEYRTNMDTIDDTIDTADTLSWANLELRDTEIESEEPRITSNNNTSSSDLMTLPAPCNTKRARSATPDRARRMRRRSDSRLSLRSSANRFDLNSVPFLLPIGAGDDLEPRPPLPRCTSSPAAFAPPD